jgi:hypothetical protein
MGSDMHMNPPSRREQREWAGKGDIINLDTGDVIVDHSTKKAMPLGYKWADDVSQYDFIRALIKAKQGGPEVDAKAKINQLQSKALDWIVQAVQALNDVAHELEVVSYDHEHLHTLARRLDDHVTDLTGQAESCLREASQEAKTLA